MAQPHFVIVRIMRRGDFHTSSAKLRIHKIIGNNRNALILQWQEAPAANELEVARIIALEAGKYVPSLLLAFRLAAAFGVRVEDVFQYEGGSPD